MIKRLILLIFYLMPIHTAAQYVGHLGSDIQGGNPIFQNTYILGKLGIGTGIPQAAIDVRGAIWAREICNEQGQNCLNLSVSAKSSLFPPDGNPLDALVVDNAGRIGIGVSSPTQSLHISGGIRVSNLSSCSAVSSDADGNLRCSQNQDSISAGLGLIRKGNNLSVGAGQGIITGEDTVSLAYLSYSCIDGFTLSGINLATGQASCTNLSLMSLWKLGSNIYTMSSVSIGKEAAAAGLAVDVEGRIGAMEYCDQNGQNCRRINEIATVHTVTCQRMQTGKNANCTATCPISYKVTGGGCQGTTEGDIVRATVPSGESAWYCEAVQHTQDSVTTDNLVGAMGYAICMRG